SFFGGHFINELRGYVARQRRDATAFLTLPSGYVDVGSALPTGGETVVALAFGGNSGLPQHTNTGSLELADEFSWLPGATAHRLKVGVDVIGTRLEENQTGNQFGTFVYPSLAALAADSAAMFTRTVVPQVHPGTAWNSALYAGDTWRVGGSLRLTYGARREAAPRRAPRGCRAPQPSSSASARPCRRPIGRCTPKTHPPFRRSARTPPPR